MNKKLFLGALLAIGSPALLATADDAVTVTPDTGAPETIVDEVKGEPVVDVPTRGGGGVGVDTTILRGGGAGAPDVDVDVKPEPPSVDTDPSDGVSEPPVVVDDGNMVDKDGDVDIKITLTGGGVDIPMTNDGPGVIMTLGGDGEVDPRIFQSGVGVGGGPEIAHDSAPAAQPQQTESISPVKEEKEALQLDDVAVKALDLAKGATKARGFSVGKKTTEATSASKAVKTGKRVFLK